MSERPATIDEFDFGEIGVMMFLRRSNGGERWGVTAVSGRSSAYPCLIPTSGSLWRGELDDRLESSVHI